MELSAPQHQLMDLRLARDLARQLMDSHGLKDWDFYFDTAKRRFGVCRYREKRISLSAALTHLNTEEEVRDTILHEIAHALAGPRAGHGPLWKAKALQIGCKPERCYGEEIVKPAATYVTECPGCGKRGQAMRMRDVACGACCRQHANGRYDPRFRLRFLRHRSSMAASAGS